MRRRAEGFSPVEANLVLWWMADETRPVFRDAMAKRELMLRRGPSPEAFNFRQSFPPVQHD